MRTAPVLTAVLATTAGVSAQLNALAKKAGLVYFGTEVDPGDKSDSAYWAVANNADNFGQVTCDNSMKWDATEPKKGSFSFGTADQQVSQALSNGQIMRCHTLVWYSQLPGWVSGGSWSASTLTSVIQSHVSNVAGHFKGKCYAWDVVNEALNDDGTYRQSVFYKVLNDQYFAIAFKAAAAADPNAKLYYNDYNLETISAKAAGAVKIVKLVQAAGARIDGVGLQAHLIVGQTPSQAALTATLKQFTALNVDVAYTELDIRISKLPSSSSTLQQQAKDYVAVVGSCLAEPRCVGITVWGFGDSHSWVPGTFSGAGEACLYDKNVKPKPAFSSVSALLAGAAGKRTSSAAAPSSTPVVNGTGTLTRVVRAEITAAY